MAPPAVSNAQIVKQLTTSWEGEVGVTKTWGIPFVTFTIDGPAPVQPNGLFLGAQHMTAAEQGMARLAFQQWNELSNLHLQEVSSGGQITFNYSNSLPSYALGETFDSTALNPLDGGNQKLSGAAVWINATDPSAASNNLTVGSYGFMAYEHEIGHALGLSHPGVYNASDPTQPVYAQDAQYSRDTRQYTIMSYFGEGSDGSGASYDGLSPETPMIDDIMAIQSKYGANITTRAGNTVYGFNSNITGADAQIYNFSLNANPVFTIWDAGGYDTIDASGFSANQRIDLNAGHYSNIGGLTQNVGIAYGVTIESAVGGSGNDSLIGNSASNVLSGGAGSDGLDGGLGFDILQGGTGDDAYHLNDVNFVGGALQYDSVVEAANAGYDTVYVQAATGLNGTGGSTTLTSYTLTANVEAGVVTGTATFNLNGNALNNALTGNGANNILNGGGGDDTLNGAGGIDTLIGGAGNDTYILNDANYVTSITSTGVIQFTAAYDAVQEDAGGGIDTVDVGRATAVGGGITPTVTLTSYTLGDNVENGRVIGTGAFDLNGNALNNVLTGNGAANTLSGGDGNDVLQGMGGFDTLIGGAGDDVYFLNDVTMMPASSPAGGTTTLLFPTYDKIVENPGGGVDTVFVGAASATDFLGHVQTATGYALGANIENGHVTGTAAFNLFGNDLNNQLFGNAAANTLSGGGGDDILNGGLGSDTFNYLAGGFGNDTITDFSAGSGLGHDVLAISQLLAPDLAHAMADFTQVGANAVLTLGTNGTVTLNNVNVSALTAADFHFV